VLLTRRTIRTAQAQAAELGGTQRRTTRARRSAGTVEPVPRASFQRARCRLLCGHRHCSESVMVTSMSSVAISPAPQHQLGWHNRERGAGVLVTSFRVRVCSSAILRGAGTQVNLHATQSLKCRLLACRYWLRRICRGRRGTSGAGPQRFLSVPSYGVS
jgi:hypothetical protein